MYVDNKERRVNLYRIYVFLIFLTYRGVQPFLSAFVRNSLKLLGLRSVHLRVINVLNGTQRCYKIVVVGRTNMNVELEMLPWTVADFIVRQYRSLFIAV